MPNYGTLQPGGTQPTALGPGESTKLFDAESPAAPQASIAIARGNSPSFSDQGTTFQMLFSANPTASLKILGSNKIPAAAFALGDWHVLATSTNLQEDVYTDTARWAYYCVYIASWTGGGTVTVSAQR